MFKIFIVLFTLSLSTFVEYKLYMLNSWMFIHHTVKKQINLWTKMFLNNKSSFSVDTKVFIYLYMNYLCWYVFYINNIYIHVYTVIGFTDKQICVCQFYMWFQEFVGLKLVPRVLYAFIDDNWHVVWLVRVLEC